MGIPDLDFETMIYDSNVRKYAFVWEKELRNGNFEPGSHVLASAYKGRDSDCHRLFHCLLSTICILFPLRAEVLNILPCSSIGSTWRIVAVNDQPQFFTVLPA